MQYAYGDFSAPKFLREINAKVKPFFSEIKSMPTSQTFPLCVNSSSNVVLLLQATKCCNSKITILYSFLTSRHKGLNILISSGLFN